MSNDTIQDVLDLLEDEWTSSNTDSVTPKFVKVTNVDYKRLNFNLSSDFIVAQRGTKFQAPNAIGADSKKVKFNFKLDLWVSGKDKEAHFYKVYNEIIRIIDANLNDPITGWQTIMSDNDNHQDLSDKTKAVWRIMIPVELNNYNVARGT